MNPYEAPPAGAAAKGSVRGKKAPRRITWIEVLIIVATIAALVAWLPREWNK
ncbi:MAG: hypothetical protein ACTHK7_19975 [Aureliella sp.]